MRPSEVLVRAAAYLEAHDVDAPRLTAEVLMQGALDTDRAGLYSRAAELSAEEARAVGRVLCRRCSGEPLQHITGTQSFMELELEVRPGVFVPRQETEVLARVAVDLLGPTAAPVAADLCAGTGALGLWIKHERPEARILAVDLSGEAVMMARDNAARLALDIDVLEGDLFAPLPPELRGTLDLVVSNPPYLTCDEYSAAALEVKADPFVALVGGTSIHRRLVAGAREWLRRGGALALEIGATQGAEVCEMFREGFDAVAVEKDLAGRDRVVTGRLS